MAQELVAFRLYAPYFGSSLYVWGSMISVIMVALAVGSSLGGWVADRKPTDLALYGTILFGAVYQLVILFTVYPLLTVFAGLGDATGTALASLVFFAPPMTAMATACPFVIRLLASTGRIGSVAGVVYGLSTAGGVGGILATSFVLVPRFGTQSTLEAICVLSTAVAVAGLALHRRSALLAVAVIGATLPLVPPQSWSQHTIWATDSPYNLVRVVRDGHWLYLELNNEAGVHTIRNERVWRTGHYYDDFALGPLLVPAKRLLVLGLGGGGSIVSTRITAPGIDIDAVEIDPRVVEAAARFFGLNLKDERLHTYVADARPWLARHQTTYDLVHVDLYQGGPYIPFYLVTQEFFEATRAHMSPDGLLMMNLFDIGPKQELLHSAVATLRRVFPSVAALSVGYGNHILLAFRRDTSAAAVRARLAGFAGDPAVERLTRNAAGQIADFRVPAGTLVFTDDRAPVEEMTRRMLHGNSD